MKDESLEILHLNSIDKIYPIIAHLKLLRFKKCKDYWAYQSFTERGPRIAFLFSLVNSQKYIIL